MGVHKTMRAQQMRHDLLPVVGPACGVCSGNWALAWKCVRDSSCQSPEAPLCPAPDQHGVATVRPLDSTECGKWLRLLFTGSHLPSASRRITSHSLKATCLSYAAKRGISLPDRLVMGYHTSGHKMPLTYSRDGAAHPLLVLENLLQEIRSGKFKPDETRSGRLVDVPLLIQIKDEPILILEEPQKIWTFLRTPLSRALRPTKLLSKV